jgi:hypothetical protein
MLNNKSGLRSANPSVQTADPAARRGPDSSSQMVLFLSGAYNSSMPKARQEDEDNEGNDREKRVENESAERQSTGEESEPEQTKRFERPDNLRRRSEWFRKRTGGG